MIYAYANIHGSKVPCVFKNKADLLLYSYEFLSLGDWENAPKNPTINEVFSFLTDFERVTGRKAIAELKKKGGV